MYVCMHVFIYFYMSARGPSLSPTFITLGILIVYNSISKTKGENNEMCIYIYNTLGIMGL